MLPILLTQPRRAATGSPLLTSLVAYYKLDEATGTRVDSTGRGNDLTPTNTPGNITGKVGSAVQLTAASSQQLTKTDTADLSIGTASFTIDGWIYFDAVAGGGVYRGVWGKWGAAGAKEWIIYHDGDINRLVLNVSSNGTATTFVIANTFGAPSATTWYYVAAGYDRANSQIWISVNNGARNNAAYSSDIFDGTATFSVGRPEPTGDHWNGRQDEIGVWKRTLTAAELTARYNGGAGNTHPFDGSFPVAFHVATASDVATMRTSLISRIWTGDGYPSAGATSTATGVSDPLTSSSSNLSRVDQLTINCGGGFTSTPYVWRPTTSINKLLLHHNGHSTNFEDGAQGDYIRAAIDAGYTVVGFTMIGGGSTTTHNTYPTPTGLLNYLRYFLEPVARAMNELSAGFSTTFMSGLSGGGWQTTLAAALDTRIKRSVPFAGAFPLFIYEPSRDWEQFLPGINDLVDFQDLFVMACDGSRRQMDSHNTTDACCFYRSQYDTYPYAGAVASRASTAGGTWSQYWDSTHSLHQISSAGRTQIFSFLSAA